MAFVLTGTAQYEAAEKQKWISFEMLLQMMKKIAECYEAERNKDKAAAEIKRALALIEVLAGEEKISRFSDYTDFFNNQLRKFL